MTDLVVTCPLPSSFSCLESNSPCQSLIAGHTSWHQREGRHASSKYPLPHQPPPRHWRQVCITRGAEGRALHPVSQFWRGGRFCQQYDCSSRVRPMYFLGEISSRATFLVKVAPNPVSAMPMGSLARFRHTQAHIGYQTTVQDPRRGRHHIAWTFRNAGFIDKKLHSPGVPHGPMRPCIHASMQVARCELPLQRLHRHAARPHYQPPCLPLAYDNRHALRVNGL